MRSAIYAYSCFVRQMVTCPLSIEERAVHAGCKRLTGHCHKHSCCGYDILHFLADCADPNCQAISRLLDKDGGAETRPTGN